MSDYPPHIINEFNIVCSLIGPVTKVADEWILPKGKTLPSQEEIDAKREELKAEYDSKKYQRDRLQEYPTIQELVVALYDEEDKAVIIERRKAVKAKYPKPT